MISIKGVGEFFSLDIGTSSIRAVQLSKAGENSWNLTGLGYVAVDPQLILSESEESRRKLGEIITTMIGQSDIKAKNVAISLSSQKTYTTIVDVPARDEKELKQTMEYQLDQLLFHVQLELLKPFCQLYLHLFHLYVLLHKHLFHLLLYLNLCNRKYVHL